MADGEGEDSVLGDKGEFEKHGTGPANKPGEDAKAREEMGHMAEKTNSPGSGGSSSGGDRT